MSTVYGRLEKKIDELTDLLKGKDGILGALGKLAIVWGILIYFVAVPLTKAINQKDIYYLRETLSGLPIVNRIGNKVLRFMESIMR